MPKKPISEELLTEKQKKDRRIRERYKKYFKKYAKLYYWKRILADPEYNKKRRLRELDLKQTKQS